MQNYKFFFLGDTGHPYRTEDHTLLEDIHALEMAQKLRSKDAIEIWQHGRQVARVSPCGRDSSSPACASR